jgi:hypothetical protein
MVIAAIAYAAAGGVLLWNEKSNRWRTIARAGGNKLADHQRRPRAVASGNGGSPAAGEGAGEGGEGVVGTAAYMPMPDWIARRMMASASASRR